MYIASTRVVGELYKYAEVLSAAIALRIDVAVSRAANWYKLRFQMTDVSAFMCNKKVCCHCSFEPLWSAAGLSAEVYGMVVAARSTFFGYYKLCACPVLPPPKNIIDLQ